MAQHFFAKELGDELIRLIKTISFSVATPIITETEAKRIPTQNITSRLNCVLVEPSTLTNSLAAEVNINSYLQVYSFNIWHIIKYGAGENITEKKITESNKIAEKLQDNIQLQAITTLPTNAQVRTCLVTGIRYDNPLNDTLIAQNLDATATQLTVDVNLVVRRTA